jgi:large subunit ribosomal protein L22
MTNYKGFFMYFVARALYIPYSPYKLRPLANVVRGKTAPYALAWLEVYKTKRSRPLKKVLASAVANAQQLKNVSPDELVIKEICVDQGPVRRYFKPGAMGRAVVQRKRLCHITVKLEAPGMRKSEQVSSEVQPEQSNTYKGKRRGTKS